MNKNEIQLRIQELKQALESQPNHPNRVQLETDLRNLTQRLENQDHE